MPIAAGDVALILLKSVAKITRDQGHCPMVSKLFSSISTITTFDSEWTSEKESTYALDISYIL